MTAVSHEAQLLIRVRELAVLKTKEVVLKSLGLRRGRVGVAYS